MTAPGSTGGPWHRAYSDNVLAADHLYAAKHLYTTFLDVLTAHVRAVAGLPTAGAHAPVLEQLEAALHRERSQPAPEYEEGVPDLFFGLQRRLEAQLGPQAMAWLRLGLSRNDLDMTVYVLVAREQLLLLAHMLAQLQDALLSHAETHVETVIIARTHHQPAQPTTLGHIACAVAWMVGRDCGRLLQALARLDRCPLGAAALAGTSHPLDRRATAQALGFAGPVENTYDAVSASDWQLEIAGLVQQISVGLSRLVHDLIASAETGLLRLPDGLVQGSSIMPQKRNPVALEHARTRLSRAAGASQQLAFASHNIPFADLNDSGNDAQEPLHLAMRELTAGLDLLVAVLAGSQWDESAIAEAVAASDTSATELADELVRISGLSYPEAHSLAAALVARMARERRPLQTARPDDLTAVGGPLLEAPVLADALSPAQFVARRSGLGGPAPDSVRAQIASLRKGLVEFLEVVDGTGARIEGALRRLRTPGKDVSA